ncbi:MAG: hypothetical protein UZ03_NOB001002649 [Nitrospira sp. OLB3]|nr:MAG: hypothetical protein UZ03_NOB001002649 [Nitrospira sp. OLB3]
MNVRGGLILLLVAFVGLLLAIGVRTFVRWVKVQSPRSAPLILAVLGLLTAGAVWLTMMEAREGPTFQPNDLVTLQEPIVVRSIPQDRDARASPVSSICTNILACWTSKGRGRPCARESKAIIPPPPPIARSGAMCGWRWRGSTA